MNRSHNYYMRKAIALAKEGKANNGGAFGAVITLNDSIVAEVYNTVKSSKDCTQHAELSAIQKACKVLSTKDLSQCILYTSCEPCMMCLGACKWANFKAIYFGTSAVDAKTFGYIYSDMYYDSDRDKRHSEFNMKQLLKEEAVAVWKNN